MKTEAPKRSTEEMRGKLSYSLGASGGGGRFLNDKGHTLPLVLVVKCQTANVGIWVCLCALIDFIEYLRGVSAAKHRQLPQCPIPSIVVAWNATILPMQTPHLHTKFNKD